MIILGFCALLGTKTLDISTEMAVFPSLTFGVAVVVVLWFVWDQQRIGRFGEQAPIAPASDWFDTTLARFPAEVVGAAWDDTVSGKEVKAILTRLVLRGEAPRRRPES